MKLNPLYKTMTLMFCLLISFQIFSQQTQRSSNFFTQQKGVILGFHVSGDNAHIVADVYALSGKHIARVLDKVVSHGNYWLRPFTGCNLPPQAYIIRLSNGVQNEFVRMINVGNEAVSNLQTLRAGSASLAKVAASNQKVIKTYQSKEIGNGVYLNQIFNDADENGVYRGFKINVQNDDNYYISSWIQGLAGSSQDVIIDGQATASGRTILKSNGWQASTVIGNSATASLATIHLSSGDHTIAFRDKGPGIPDVEFIRLGKTEIDVFISDSAFQNKLVAIKAYAASHPIQPVSEDSTIAPLTYNPPPRNDPLNDYTGYLAQPFSYTYRGWFDFNQGDHPVFSIQNATTNCVMYLYKPYDLTPSTSWFGFNIIDVTIPSAGSYIVMVRAYYSGYSGTADLYLNGSIYTSGIIVAGNYYNSGLSKTGTINYFTCNPPNNPYTTDTYIYITRYFRYAPIAAWNDDYIGSGNFTWGYWSRCKIDLSSWSDPHGQVFIIGSAYSSYGNGNCDFYLCNGSWDGTACSSLNSDDAIESALANSNYNCFSWSGGRTDLGGTFDPYTPGSPWYVQDSVKRTFNNFYGNKDALGNSFPRFVGAMTYDTTPNADESVIDLYSELWPQNYTHASVRKPGDNFMHGYDWESKLGTSQRIFHPRNEVSCYGSLSAYYKYSGQVARSASAVNGNRLADKLSLSDNDMEKIDTLASSIDLITKVAFDSLYDRWKKTWASPELNIQSSPYMFFYSAEYSQFEAFCLSKGKLIIPLCFKKYFEGDELVAFAVYRFNMFSDSKIMDRVLMSSDYGKISSDGYYIIDRQVNGWIRYFKILLNEDL